MRSAIEQTIRDRAATDADFRAELIAESKPAITTLLGIDVPEGITVRVIEEDAGEIILVLPPTAPRTLSDDELDRIDGALGDGGTAGRSGSSGSGY